MLVNSRVQLYPVLRLALAMIIGIVMGNVFTHAVAPIAWGAMLVASFIAVLLLKRHILILTADIYLFFLFWGGWLITHQMNAQEVLWETHPVGLQGVIINTPVEKAKTIECDVRVVPPDNHNPDVTTPSRDISAPLIKAFIMKDKRSMQLDVGDGISFSSLVRAPYNRGNIAFDYARHLRLHGFSGTTFIDKDFWCQDAIDLSALSIVERAKLKMMRLRSAFLHRYSLLGITGQTYAVTAALTLGDKSYLSKSTKTAYSQAGTSHILALSGLHLGILYTILLFLLGKRHHLITTPVILLAVWTFVLMVGMSPSVVRAAVMLSIHAFVSMLNRDKMSVNTLALAAMMMLAYNAQCLFDVGFQLSFFAVLFILLLYPQMRGMFSTQWMRHHRFLSLIIQMMLVSIAAQIGTFPLVMHYFGNFPVYFLLTNIIVIPIATAVLYLSVVLFALFCIPAVQHFLALILTTAVSWMNCMMDIIHQLPHASISDLHPSPTQVCLIYISIFSVYFLIQRRTPLRLKLSLTMISAMLLSFLPIF